MPKKEPLTLYNQDYFDVEKDCRAKLFDFDDWDTPEKISNLLWHCAPLLAEFELSEECRTELRQSAKEIFNKMLSDPEVELSLMEEQIMTLEAVFLMQRKEEQEDGRLWSYLFSEFGYNKENSYGFSAETLYKWCTDILRNTVLRHNRLYAEWGQQYYNTLNIHALTPSWAIEHLFNILYCFYSTNLEFHYEPHDQSFVMLVQNLTSRWNSKKESEAELRLRSDTLSSGLKMLFIHRPNFMAAVCDALIERIDTILKDGLDQLDDQSRWNVLLKKWYRQKTANEKEEMLKQRKKASREHVITQKGAIRLQYRMSGEQVYLQIPRIRLPEIKERPVAQLIQNGKVVKQIFLSVFGDDLCLTTREAEFSISQNEEINWMAQMNFAVRIVCGDCEIYHSGTALFRKYILFSIHGEEIKTLKPSCTSIYLLTDNQTDVDISDSDEDYCLLDARGQLLKIEMSGLNSVEIDGTDIMTQENGGSEVFYYLSNYSEGQAYIKTEQGRADICRDVPQITIELPHHEAAKNYVVYLNSVKHGLYEYGAQESSIRFRLPKTTNFLHHVELRRFSDNKTLFSISYIIFPQFSVQFERPIYPNQYCKSTVNVHCMGNNRNISFELEENQNEVDFELRQDMRCYLKVPKLKAIISGRNALSLGDRCWYEEFEQDDFLRIEAPEDFQTELILGPEKVPSYGQYYEVGNYLHSKITWPMPTMVLGIIVRYAGKVIDQVKLTEVVFQEFLTGSPVKLYDQVISKETKRVIDWDPRGLFIGPRDASFRVELETDQQKTWNYAETLKKNNMERNFPCRDGVYHYKVYLLGKKKIISETKDRILYEGDLTVGDPNIFRFCHKKVKLNHVYFWSYETNTEDSAPLQNGNAILTDIQYIGYSIPEGEDQVFPEYRAELCYEASDGTYQKYSRYSFSGHQKVNPVSFWVCADERIRVQTENEELLWLYVRRTRNIKTVRVVDNDMGLSSKERYQYIKEADNFEFQVVPEKER